MMERGEARTFVVETVDPVDGGALVVAPEDEEVLWVFDFVGEEEADGFEALLAPVDVVAQEEVVGIGREPAVLEQTQQVIVLPVNVACRVGRSRNPSGLDDGGTRPNTTRRGIDRTYRKF